VSNPCKQSQYLLDIPSRPCIAEIHKRVEHDNIVSKPHAHTKGLDLLAEYIWPATCSLDHLLPDVLVLSRLTFPVNKPAAAGLSRVNNTKYA
jgi:hypothetical protein